MTSGKILMKPLLQMKNITKEFSGVQVLHEVDFEIQPGEIMALMGENGAGKSTLMKILAGVHTDWSGKIIIDDKEVYFKNTKDAEKAGIGIIYQELNLIPELTVAENIFLGREPAFLGEIVNYSEMNKKSEEILADLHFTAKVTLPVSRLRVGHQQLVEIGKALSLNASIVIMDEPTSAISEHEIKILFSVVQKLKERGVSIIYISHRMAEVFELADRVTVLRDGYIVGVRPVKDITRQELIKMMVGRDVNQFFVRERIPPKETIFEVKNLTRYHVDRTKTPVVSDVSFDVKRGELIGIAGLLGAGRTELLESLFGAAAADSTGTVELEGEKLNLKSPQDAIKSGIAFITEDRKGNGLILGMDIQKNMTLAALGKIVSYGIISPVKEKQLAENYANQLSIKMRKLDDPIESLSGGNQQKVLLAKWLATKPRVILLDEPTRGIDVGAKHEIYILLSELTKKGITIIMTSSELPELLAICDRIIVLREGKLSAIFNHKDATQEDILDAAAPLA
jgi:ABC-type sugar transport system ATPase subunit